MLSRFFFLPCVLAAEKNLAVMSGHRKESYIAALFFLGCLFVQHVYSNMMYVVGVKQYPGSFVEGFVLPQRVEQHGTALL